jgi:hypothetical protein
MGRRRRDLMAVSLLMLVMVILWMVRPVVVVVVVVGIIGIGVAHHLDAVIIFVKTHFRNIIIKNGHIRRIKILIQKNIENYTRK